MPPQVHCPNTAAHQQWTLLERNDVRLESLSASGVSSVQFNRYLFVVGAELAETVTTAPDDGTRHCGSHRH